MLEPWPEGQAAIEVLGYTNVRAFRWAGGQLSGWVHFDGEEKSRRESLDLQDGLTEEAHPRRAGQIIVAERAVEGKTGVVECWVWARLETDWVSPHVGKVYTAVPLTHHGFCSVHREPQASEPDETADESEGPRIIERKALSELSSGRVFQLWRGDPREVNQKLERILEAPDLLGDERFGPFLNVEVIPSQVHQEHAEPSVGADSR